MTASMFDRCYAGATQAGSLDRLAHQQTELTAEEIVEVQMTAAAII